MKRAALYVRVSTEEQKKHGLSVVNQIDALNKYCEENNIYPYRIYSDAGISGRKSFKKRPAMLEMIEDIKAGMIDIILFTRLDRWFRSVKDYYLVMEQIGDVPWKAIWEDYETETSSGQFKVNIMLSVSQAEAERTSEKIKSVLQYKIEQGEHVGPAPIGMKTVDKRLVPDPETQNQVVDVFRTYLTTFSLTKTAKITKRSFKGVVYILTNQNYVGKIISQEDFDLANRYIGSHTRSYNKDRIYIYSGMMICPYCGRKMDGQAQLGEGRTTLRYICKDKKCKYFSISQNKIEKIVLDSIEGELEKYKQETYEIMKESEKNKKTRDQIDASLRRLKDLYIDGDIEKDEYTRRKEDLEKQIVTIVSKISPKLPKIPSDWLSVYAELDPVHKRSFWRKIIKDIRINKEKDTVSISFV